MIKPLDLLEPEIEASINGSDEAALNLKARAGIQQAIGVQADQFAEALQISEKTQLPLDVVERNKDAAKKKAALDSLNIEQVLADAPEARQWLSDPVNSKLVSDDFSMIGRAKKIFRDIPKAAEASKDMLTLQDLRYRQMFDTVTPEELAQAEAISTSLDQMTFGTGGIVSDALTETARNAYQLTSLVGAQVEGGVKGGAAGASLGAAAALSANVIPPLAALPEEAITLPAATVAMGTRGAVLGSRAYGWYENFRQQSSMIFDDMLKIRGENGEKIDFDTARGAAVVAAVPSALLDYVAYGKLMDTVPGADFIKNKLNREGVRELVKMPGMKEAFKRIGVKFAKGITVEGITEGAQEAIQIMAEEAAKTSSDGQYKSTTLSDAASRVGQSAYTGALVGTVIGGAGSTVAAGIEYRRQRQATPDQVAAHVQQINQGVRENVLYQRNPERFRALVDSLAGDERLYAPYDAVNSAIESLEPAQREALFSAVPDLKVELDTAAETNADVAIRKADYITFIAPYPQADALAEFMKLDPADMSVAERNEYQQFLTQNPEVAATMMSEGRMLPPAAPEETQQAIERIVRKALTEAGRGGTEARALAPLFSRTLSRFATPFGENAVEYLNRGLLQFETQDAAGAALKKGSNFSVLMNDLQQLRAGKRISADDQMIAAVNDFGRRLDEAGIAPDRAAAMRPEELLNMLYKRQQPAQETTLTQMEGQAANMIEATLSANTDTIEGIRQLAEAASGGDVTAHATINQIAQNSLQRLLSGTSTVTLNADFSTGLYGGVVEPSLGLKVNFDDSERPQVLAALAQFADNFNQEQIHVRQDVSEPVGGIYTDGSYVTSVFKFSVSSPVSRQEIEQIIAETGISGLTFSESSIEAYYVGDPENNAAIDDFTGKAGQVESLLGDKNAGVVETAQRLWVYGNGGIPYDQIAGDLRTAPPSADATAKLLAERYFGGSLTPAQQAPSVTQDQATLQRRIAQLYESMPDNDMSSETTSRAYRELVQEVKEQYRTLPLKEVIAWVKRDENGAVVYDEAGDPLAASGEPYEDSQAMMRDVQDKNRMKFYATTRTTFGLPGVDLTGHPLLEETEFTDSKGYPMLANDVLRVVHDYFAHDISKVGFGPLGEEAAWKNHMMTIKSPWARWALTSETRGQNSWVNFNKDVYGADIPLRDRPFARQKAALLPLDYALTGDEAVDAPVRELMAQLPPGQLNGSLTQEQVDVPLEADDITNSTEFKAWFGDSKVVDAEGKPLVVYHGTNADFEAFDEKQSGSNYYAGMAGFFFADRVFSATPYGENIIEAYLSLQNPLVVNSKVNSTDGSTQGFFDNNADEILERAKAKNHDGIIVRSKDGKDNTYIAFSPTQIKSVFNRGTFDPNDARILFQQVKRNELGLYSQLEKEVLTMNFPAWKASPKKALTEEESSRLAELRAQNIRSTGDENYDEFEKLMQRERESQGLASGSEVWAKIKSLPLKKEELEWTGIEEFLTASTEKFTRQEVVDFIRGNGVRVTEVVADQESTSGEFDWSREVLDADQDYLDSETQYYTEAILEDDDEVEAIISSEIITSVGEEEIAAEYTEQGGELSFDPDEFSGLDLSHRLMGDKDFIEWVKKEYEEKIKVEAEIRAADRAIESYNDNPIYRWYDPNTEYEITGNNDIGYSVYNGRGKGIEEGVSSFNEAEIRAYEYARENDDLISEDDERVAKWGDYVMRGPNSNYRELKLTLPEIDGDFEYDVHFPDRNIVAFLRLTDRTLSIPGEDYKAKKQEFDAKVDEIIKTFTDEVPPDYTDSSGIKWSEWLDMQQEIIANQPERAEVAQERINEKKEQWKTSDGTRRSYAERLLKKEGVKSPDSTESRTYFIDEFQSDWHQQGRTEGYKTGKVDAGELESKALAIDEKISEAVLKIADNPDIKEIYDWYVGNNGTETTKPDDKYQGNIVYAARALLFARSRRGEATNPEMLAPYDRLAETDEVKQIFKMEDEAKALRKAVKAERSDIPDAPFKGDSWIALGLKRALVDAAEKGYDALAWPNQEVLVDRWHERYRELYATQYDRKMPSIVEKLTKVRPQFTPTRNEQGYWSIPITDALRQKILGESFPMFQGERGNITLATDMEGNLRRVVVAFKESANFSTGAHEFSHWAVAQHRIFARMARSEIASGNDNAEIKRILDDWEKLKEEVGATGDDFTVAQEEKIASMFEGYLRKGEAPSEGLRRIFTRFRDWLTKIYRDITGLGMEVSPEIAGVFDRWLASEAEIAKVRDKNSSLAEIAIKAGLPADIVQRIADYMNSATAHAEETLYRQLDREQKARETQAYKGEFDRLREEVADEFKQRREYSLMDYMRQNDLKFIGSPETDGVSQELISEAEGEGVIHPDSVADLYGYDSGVSMLRSLKATPDFDRAVNSETRKRLMDKYPDMIAQKRITGKATDAIINDRVLLAMDVLIKEMGKSANGERVGMKQFAKVMAQEQVSKMKMSEVNYAFRYEAARERSLREALKSARAGDNTGALLNLQRAMVNQTVYKSLIEFSELREKAGDLFARVDAKDKELAPRADIDFIGAARFLLNKYGLGGENFDINAWLADMQEREPDIMQDLMQMSRMVSAPAKPAKELTVAEFLDVYNSIENIFWVAKKMKEFQIADKKMKTQTAAAELMEQLSKIEAMPTIEGTQVRGGARVRSTLMGLKAVQRRVEHWTRSMDAGKSGPFTKYLWKPISDSANDYRIARSKWMNELNKILQDNKELLRKPGKIAAPEMVKDVDGQKVPMVFNDKQELIGFLLHTGNTSNLEKLIGGYGISQEQYEVAMSQMQRDGRITAEDMKLVQKLWDFAENLKPISQKAHKRLYGYRFEEIESMPIKAMFGTYRGGYWPAIVDYEQVDSKNIEQAISDAKQFMLASTNKGFTKSRVKGYKKQLSTNLKLASSHVDSVLRFAYLEPAVRDVSRLVNNQDFKDALKARDTAAYGDMLMPWLQRAARQTTVTPGAPGSKADPFKSKVFRHMRVSASAQTMMGNLSNALQNITGFSVAGYEVGMRNLAKAFGEYMANPAAAGREIQSMSKMMRSRQAVIDVDVTNEINDIVMRRGYFTKAKNAAAKHGYIFQRIMQGFVDNITWKAAFTKAVADGKSDSQASEYADSVVRRTQSSLNPEDVSKIEAGSEGEKLFLMFYSYFNNIANFAGTEARTIMRDMGWAGTPKLFYLYVMVAAAPAFLADMIAQGLRGNLPDDGDDDGEIIDDWLAFFAGGQARYAAATVPFAGQALNSFMNFANKKPYDDRLSTSPALSQIETTMRFAARELGLANPYTDSSNELRDGLNAIGFVTGLPLGQLGKPAGFLVNVNEGDESPSTAAGYARGLIGGPSAKK